MSETPTDCTYCDGSGTKLEKYKGCDSECGCTDIVPCEECNGTGVSLLAQLTEAVKRAEAAGADALKWKITSDAHCLVMIEDLHPKIDKLGGAIDRLTNERDELKARLQNMLAIIHGDGGHYIAEHGLSKACDDATTIHVDLKERCEKAEAELERKTR